MDKTIILAKAGSGKTYHICNVIDPQKRNIILAFTNQNISNILKELEKIHGEIPEHTVVMTFHSFLYHTFIRPFELLISEYFKCKTIHSDGVSVETPEQPYQDGKPNWKYVKKDRVGHYYTSTQKQIYVSRMSEIVLQINSKECSLLRCGISYLNVFFDAILVDEVQDFRGFDWKFLEGLIKGFDNITLVGDFYQHSVSGDNNSGVPFDKCSTYELYKSYLNGLNVVVDELTLSATRRCPQSICEFVTRKTGISIESHRENGHMGQVRVVSSDDEAQRILSDISIKKLLWNKSEKSKYNTINWGYSKGDTYSSVCVVLTEKLSDLLDVNFSLPDGSTKNKLYVALTRTQGDLYIMTRDVYERINLL